MAENFFKQTPIAPSNLKPIIPEGTDLNRLSDQITREKAKIDADAEAGAKKFGDELLAGRIKAAREDAAESARKRQEAEAKRLWHEGNAKTAHDKEARKLAAAQLAIKTKLAALSTACAEVEALFDELTDKNCIQAKLAYSAMSQLMHRIKIESAFEEIL